jgi:hypothetical protein
LAAFWHAVRASRWARSAARGSWSIYRPARGGQAVRKASDFLPVSRPVPQLRSHIPQAMRDKRGPGPTSCGPDRTRKQGPVHGDGGDFAEGGQFACRSVQFAESRIRSTRYLFRTARLIICIVMRAARLRART